MLIHARGRATVGGRCDGGAVEKNARDENSGTGDNDAADENDAEQDGGAPTLETVAAAQLRVTDVVRREGALRVVTSLRMQGVPPEVCVEFAGLAGRHHYPAAARVGVLPRRRA